MNIEVGKVMDSFVEIGLVGIHLSKRLIPNKHIIKSIIQATTIEFLAIIQTHVVSEICHKNSC